MCYRGHMGAMGWSSHATPKIIEIVQLRNKLADAILNYNFDLGFPKNDELTPMEIAFDKLDKLLSKLDMDSRQLPNQMELPLT